MEPINTNLNILKNDFITDSISQQSKYPYRFKHKYCNLIIMSANPNPFDKVLVGFSPQRGKSDKGKYCNKIVIKVSQFNPDFDSGLIHTELHKHTAYIDSGSVPGQNILFFASLPAKIENCFVAIFATKNK